MPTMTPYVTYRTKRLSPAKLERKTPSPYRRPPATPTARGPARLMSRPPPKAAMVNTKLARKNATLTSVMFAPYRLESGSLKTLQE
jgi:hypothetical protein